MTRTQAIQHARDFADRAVREVRGIISDAIEYRRTEPLRFSLFHRRMAQYWEGRGRRVRGRWHRYWETRYAAKAWALDQSLAQACGIAV